jgi:hypothetical protein
MPIHWQVGVAAHKGGQEDEEDDVVFSDGVGFVTDLVLAAGESDESMDSSGDGSSSDGDADDDDAEGEDAAEVAAHSDGDDDCIINNHSNYNAQDNDEGSLRNNSRRHLSVEQIDGAHLYNRYARLPVDVDCGDVTVIFSPSSSVSRSSGSLSRSPPALP